MNALENLLFISYKMMKIFRIVRKNFRLGSLNKYCTFCKFSKKLFACHTNSILKYSIKIIKVLLLKSYCCRTLKNWRLANGYSCELLRPRGSPIFVWLHKLFLFHILLFVLTVELYLQKLILSYKEIWKFWGSFEMTRKLETLIYSRTISKNQRSSLPHPFACVPFLHFLI